MAIEKLTIKNLISSARFDGEFSFLDLHIVGSRKLIQEIYDSVYKLLDKYPKSWDKKKED